MDHKLKNYFEYNGKKYYEGTIIEFEDKGKIKYGEYSGSGDVFTSMTTPDTYEANGRAGFFADGMTVQRVIKPIDSYSKIEMVKAYKDTECDHMFYAWVVYITVMIFATLLNERLIAWVCITIYFCVYRKRKLYVSKTSYDNKKRTGGI